MMEASLNERLTNLLSPFAPKFACQAPKPDKLQKTNHIQVAEQFLQSTKIEMYLENREKGTTGCLPFHKQINLSSIYLFYLWIFRSSG
jgi:hypothetical protein